MMNATRPMVAACAILMMAGCSTLPASGPSSHDIERAGKASQPSLAVVPVTTGVLDVLRASEHDAPPPALPAARVSGRIGPDDVLQVTIFETGLGLFSPGQVGTTGAVSASSTATTLPQIIVPLDGYITLPYVGRMLAAGKTLDELRNDIERVLSSKRIASQPQVLVTQVSSTSNSVYVSGDVKTPGRYALTLTPEYLLDAITMAGSGNHMPYDTTVILSRDGARREMVLGDVQPGTPYDIELEPGDRILLAYEPRSFMVFGATQKPAQVTFDTQNVTLAQALGRAGGLIDQQADPRAVYVFRRERPAVAARLGLTAAAANAPVIYHFDMRQPGAMFLADAFEMRNGDVIYAADAPSESLHKVMGLISGVFAPAAAAGGIANLTR